MKERWQVINVLTGDLTPESIRTINANRLRAQTGDWATIVSLPNLIILARDPNALSSYTGLNVYIAWRTS